MGKVLEEALVSCTWAALGTSFQCPHTALSTGATGGTSGLQSGLQLLLQ